MNATGAKVTVLLVFAAVMTTSGAARAAQVITGSGSNLLRRNYTLAHGQQIIVQTTGCSSASADTVLFLFEGLGLTRTTRGYSDDAGISPDPACSYINFFNTSGSPKTYQIVGTNYPGSAGGAITYKVWRSSIGWSPNEVLTLRGVANRPALSGTNLFETVGRRPMHGGFYIDTVLYVIDTTLGSTATRYDDDSSMGPLSRLTASPSCTNFNCWIVAGDYQFGGFPSTFQIWSNSTSDVDSDGDKIPNSLESLLGTNVFNSDWDGDGLSDFEEFRGVAAASLTGVDASLIMPWQGGSGADPFNQDLFVEVEYMVNTNNPHTHNPLAATNWNTFAADLVNTFQNDEDFTSRFIIPHVEVSNSLTETVGVTFGNCGQSGVTTRFYDVKTSPMFFDPLRAGIFHYVIIGHALMTQNCSGTLSTSGQAEIWGNDAIITLGGQTSEGTGTPNAQHGTFVHELGHNLSLSHWGNGNPGTPGPNSCVHSSVMNYRWQFDSWGDGTMPTARRWGYSNGQCPTVGHGCGNTCNAARCVPSTETSPKMGCSPNNGSCDCDRGEWSIVNLDIPGGTEFTFTDCAPGVQCSGANGDLTRAYFLGDRARYGSAHRSYAAKRREKLTAMGLTEGRDFTTDPQTGRLYSIE